MNYSNKVNNHLVTANALELTERIVKELGGTVLSTAKMNDLTNQTAASFNNAITARRNERDVK